MPPSYAKLVNMIDQGYPWGQRGGPRSTAATAELYQAASAAHWIAKYNIEKNIPGKVSQPSLCPDTMQECRGLHGMWCIGRTHPRNLCCSAPLAWLATQYMPKSCTPLLSSCEKLLQFAAKPCCPYQGNDSRFTSCLSACKLQQSVFI